MDASPSGARHGDDDSETAAHQLQSSVTELKMREEDGAMREAEPPISLKSRRREIEAALRPLRAHEDERRARDAAARDAQRDRTRSLVKLMHLDTADQTKVETHTAHAALQNEIDVISEKMRKLEDRYQQEKKGFATMPDKNERHRQVQLAKDKRDRAVGPLRERLKDLDPNARPPSSFQKPVSGPPMLLPTLVRGSTPGREASSTVYRQITDQIRELQKARKTMHDPYMADLKMARLWNRINEHERALEKYHKALKSLKDKEKLTIPEEDLPHVLETERKRKQEALQFLFIRSLDLNVRDEAADLMKRFLHLSTTEERHETAMYLESILRKLPYVEDPSLSTPEAVATSILCSGSLGPLTDLRFNLLEELLAASPQDPFLLEAVANLHVRKSDFGDARAACDRFVKLPEVKRLQLFASFGKFTPSD